MHCHLLAAGSVALFGAAGCPDPNARFNEFNPIASQSDSSVGEPPPFEELPDVTGTFLFGLSPKPSPDKVVQGRLESTLIKHADDTGSLELTFVALHKDTRVPVGPTQPFPAAAVSSSGTFQLEVTDLLIPKEANSQGLDLYVTATVAGALKNTDRFCGTIPQGQVTRPVVLDLKGSTWSAIRVPPGSQGDSLPPPEIKCPPDSGTPSDGGIDPGPADAAPDACLGPLCL